MFTSDVLGRVHPVASLQTLDRGSFQSLQEDVLDLSRVSESGAAVLSAHLLTWARSGEGRRHRAHHSSDERTGTHAPIGFASDHAPALDAHECIAGTCVRPFPPLLIESAIQRYSWTDVASERHQAALTLSELFIAQCAQMLHTMRFTAGRDLFAHDFLCDIDEIMRGAIWSGDAKGRKAAGEVLGIDIDTAATATTFDPASSPRLSPSGSAELKPTRPNYDRSSSVAASSAAATSASSHAAASTANLTAASSDRRSRRASQDSLIHHPFAPNAYDNATPSGAHTSRVIGGAHDGRGGRGLSRRILSTSAVAQRPRQCLVSSLLALLRFANGLGVRLKYWRGQLKAKQSEIARLTALAEAKQHEGEAATDAADPTADREVTTLRAKVDALESQLAVAHATLSEYESSGRVRHRYEPEFGDTSIPARPHIDVDGPLAGQVAALQLALDAARQENMTLIREGNDRLADHTSMRDAQHASLDALRAELAASRSEARAREEALAAVQSLADERELKVNQLGGMLAAIKERVTSREKEWEQREEAWKRGTTVRNDHEQDDDAAARAAAEYAAKEAAWFASQSARDDMEASLQAAATRAKQAHNSVLREYEELRRENVRVSAEVDAERKEMEARLKRCNASLSDARATIASLKAQLKKLQDERAMAVAAAVAAPAPPTTKPKDTTKEDRARIKREAAESLKQLELEMAAADAAAAEEKQRAAEAAAVAAAAAAERIKLAAAKLKKEKAARRKEAEAAAAAVAAAAAASQQVPPEEKKSRKKPRVAEAPPEDVKEVVQPPKMAPPTAQELAKPTPKRTRHAAHGDEGEFGALCLARSLPFADDISLPRPPCSDLPSPSLLRLRSVCV